MTHSTKETFDLSTFTFGEHTLRTVKIDGEPWFVVKDVCLALGIYINKGTVNATVACRKVGEGEKGLYPIHTPTPKCPDLRTQVVCVNESGLYKLILRADGREAKPFQDWVTKDVIPAIRKDGAYIQGEEKVVTGEMSEDEFILKAMTILQKKVERLAEENSKLTASNLAISGERDELRSGLDLVGLAEWAALNHIYLPRMMKGHFGMVARTVALERRIERKTEARTLGIGSTVQQKMVNVWPRAVWDEAARRCNITAMKKIEPKAFPERAS